MFIRVVCFVLFVLFMISNSEARISDSIKKSFDVKRGGTLGMNCDLGRIEVRGTGEERVDIEVRRDIRAGSEEEEQEILSNLEIEFDQNGNDVFIRSRFHEGRRGLWGWDGWRNRYLRLEFIITVPMNYNVDLRTGDEDIVVSGLQGECRCKTSDGNLVLNDISGMVYAKTSDGDIEVDRCKKSIDVQTSDGDIDVGVVDGDVIAKTSDGEISIKQAQGSVSASTSDGDIEIREFSKKIHAKTSDGSITAYIKNQVDSDCSLSASDGEIKVYLADNIKLTVNAKTSDGHVKSDLPLTIIGETKDDRLQAKLNGGGPELYLRTSDERIYLSRL